MNKPTFKSSNARGVARGGMLNFRIDRRIIAFIYSAEDANSTQTLHVGINSPTTENAYTETTKYLLFFLDREYKQRA